MVSCSVMIFFPRWKEEKLQDDVFNKAACEGYWERGKGCVKAHWEFQNSFWTPSFPAHTSHCPSCLQDVK